MTAIDVPAQLDIHVEDDQGMLAPIVRIVQVAITNDSRCLPDSSSSAQTQLGQDLSMRTDTISFRISEVEPVKRIGEPWNTHQIAMFCINSPDDISLSTSPKQSAKTLGQAEDGRFLLDFDTPPTTSNDYHREVANTEYLGLILFQRKLEEAAQMGPKDDDIPRDETPLAGEYCVMLTSCICDDKAHTKKQSCHQCTYRRAGLLWINDDHTASFQEKAQTIRLC